MKKLLLIVAIAISAMLVTSCEKDTKEVECKKCETCEQCKDDYTVTFISDGKEVNALLYAKGSKIAEPKLVLRAGYKFDGWFKDANFEKGWNFASDVVTADMSLYAKWRVPEMSTITMITAHMKIYFTLNGTGSFTINWGDGNTETGILCYTFYQHIYPNASSRTITITGEDILITSNAFLPSYSLAA